MSIFSKSFWTMQPEEEKPDIEVIQSVVLDSGVIVTPMPEVPVIEAGSHVFEDLEVVEIEPNRTFFDTVRTMLFGGKLSQGQVDGMNMILKEWDARGIEDLKWLAYMLGTVFWESGRTMQPVEERGRGKGYFYGVPHPKTGKIYFGRGRIQLTLYDNYLKFEKLLNIPLTTHPELMLENEVDLQVLFIGMIQGLYTGAKLADYFNDRITDWYNARKIVNSNDKKTYKTIADYAQIFYSAL